MRLDGAGGRTALLFAAFSVSAALPACSAGSGGGNNAPGNDNSGGGSAGATGSGGNAAAPGGLGLGGSVVLGGSTNGPAGLAKALAFDPPTVTLVVDDSAATPTAEYSLTAIFEGDQTAVVTAESLEFDRPDLASFTNGAPVVLTATGAVSGTGKLHAIYGGLEATADLEVQIVERHVEGAVPDAVVEALDGDGTAPAQDPSVSKLLYPYDKTVFALGLQSPLIMWDAPVATAEYYRLRVEQAGYTYDLYQAVTPPVAAAAPYAGKLRIPQQAWDRITTSNAGDPMAVTLSRYDSASSTVYGVATHSFTIAPESLGGAIYYWTAARDADQGNITRIYPGEGGAPETLTTGKCMGCHYVSADGSTLVADVEDPAAPSLAPYPGYGGTRAWAAFQLPGATLIRQTTMYGANPALTPDGKYLVFGAASNPVQPGSKNFSLAVTQTGQVIADSGLDDIVFSQANVNLMMPSFSLDGTKLAAVEGGGNLFENVIPESKRIVYMDFDASIPKFDPTLHEIVNIGQFPAGNQGFGYPAFTPDNRFVAYHTGKYSTGCNPDGCGDDTPDGGEIWVSPVSGGAPIRLSNLNDPPNTKDHYAGREPTFCPVKRGGYSWMVFTSMRDWGNELTAPAPNTNFKRRLWVAAIDGEIGSADPSHPAFYIEGQENTPNMRGFWTLAACIQTPPPGSTGEMCKANFECCSGFCVEGQCIEKTTLTCSGIGEACENAGNCCNRAAVSCIDMKCAVRPPPK